VPASQATLSQPTRAAIDEALGQYETVRAKLAADDMSGLADTAKKMASAATKGAGAAPERLRPHLQTMAEQATKLAATGTDIEQNRVAFGEVSRAVVGLLVAEPSFQTGRFVFHCPMAKGYKKWVQVDAKLENPFMGKKMLECGGKSSWEV
jgi:Cu(I)/Ag(I) efflux system membrane fusion protein